MFMGEIKHILMAFILVINTLFFCGPVSAEEAGATPWYDLPFGKMRFLSCQDGINHNTLMMGGLQITLQEGWILNRPHLESLDPKTPLWIEYPIRPDSQKTQSYEKEVFISIAGMPQLSPNHFVFGVYGELQACHAQHPCLTVPVRMVFPLKSEQGQYTSYCAYIMDQMRQVPVLPHPNQKMFGQIMDAHHLRLLITGFDKVNQAFLQNDSGVSFEVLSRVFSPHSVQFDLKVGKTLTESENQNWILITNLGIYRMPVQLTAQKLPDVPMPFPWFSFLFGGAILFVCSPFWVYWGLAWPKNKHQVQSDILHIVQMGTLTLLVWIGGIYLCRALNIVDGHSLTWIRGLDIVLLAGMLLFPPRHWWSVCGLFLILPKPYLSDILSSFSNHADWLVMWGIGGILWLWFFFYMRYKLADNLGKLMRACLKKHFFFTNLFFLLPTVILLFWNIDTCQNQSPPYQRALQSGVNVVCAPHDCQKWMKVKHYPVTLIDATSDLGKQLKKQYSNTAELVIFVNQNEQTVFNKPITPKQIGIFKTEWQNYHALCKPKNPPIHFDSVPHDL